MQNSGIDPNLKDRLKFGLAEYYHGIERRKRKEEMMSCTMTLQELVQKGQASLDNINQLLKSKSLQGHLDDALVTFDDAVTLGFQPNAESFLSLIQGATERCDPASARMIYLKMRSRLISPTPRVYGALIHAHVNSGDISAGFALMAKMEDEGLKPDVVIYTTLINGLVESSHHEMAWTVFRDMRSWKLIEPDEVLFTVMIKSCAMTNEVERALNTLDDMRTSGKHPTDITYTELIHACCKDSHFFDKAFDFFNQMNAEDMPLTPTIFQYLLESCSTTGNLERSKSIISEMQKRHMHLDDLCCISLIKTLGVRIKKCRANQSKRDSILVQTWSVLQYINRSAQKVTTEILDAVMSVYISGGMSHYAVDMLFQYSQFQCDPSSQTYHQLLKMFYEDLRDPGRFFGLWNFLTRETSIKPSTEMLHLAVDAAVLSGSSAQTVEILQMMYRMQVLPSPRITARLARVGRHVPELTQLIMSFVKLEQTLQIDRTKLENQSIDSNLKEHELNQYINGRTLQSLTVEDEVRKEYFDQKEEKMKGKHKLPKGLYKQLKKEGGEYYARIRDGHVPNLNTAGPGVSSV